MNTYNYPKAPAGVSDDILKPSQKFKNEVAKIAIALGLFVVLYFVLLIAGILFAIACAIAGVGLMAAYTHWFTILFGVGLMGLGVMVVYFLVKFLFSTKKPDNRGVEVFEADQPMLFDFIRRVGEETKTDFPKHIYLTPEVNASVSYDSNIRSMFFPVKKNLTIGLGLVNMVNLSEFKSVIAHEFGHFSQKSMKAGVFVYQANKVIYNMLYDNESYGRMLDTVASVHSVFALVVGITVKIVKFIQWILQQAYKVINKQYASLSREMEFNADAMAAKASGSNNAIQALRRIDFGSSCYDETINRYNQWLSDNLKGENIYSQQRIVARFISEEHDLALEQGLPVLKDKTSKYRNYNRIVVTNQWASHPTLKEREDAYNELGIAADTANESAWVLFNGKEKLQTSFTDELYKNVKFEQQALMLDDAEFTDKYDVLFRKYDFPKFYNGYYDNRDVSEIDLDNINEPAPADIKAFFDEKGDTLRRITGIKQDIDTLDYIQTKDSGISTFDFDGVKYTRKNAEVVKQTLLKEVEDLASELKRYDAQVYAYYLAKATAKNRTEELKDAYKLYFEFRDAYKENETFYETMASAIRPFYSDNSTQEQAEKLNKELILIVDTFKINITKTIKSVSNYTVFYDEIAPAILTDIQPVMFEFLKGSEYNTENLDKVSEALNSFMLWTYDMKFKVYKALLDKQLEIA